MRRKMCFVLIGMVLAVGLVVSFCLLKNRNNIFILQQKQSYTRSLKGNSDKTIGQSDNKRSETIQDSSSTTKKNTLPKSGCGDDFSKILIISCLFCALVYYLRSRRKPFDL